MHQHPPGRLTMPRVPLTDKAFVYTCSAATDVQATFQRARLQLQQEAIRQQLAEAQRQPALPGIAQPRTVQRLRAGIGSVIALPSL